MKDEKKILKAFATKLAKARAKKGLSQSDLSKACECKQSHYAMFERSDAYPARKQLALICCYLELDYWKLKDMLKAERKKAYELKLTNEYDLSTETLDRIMNGKKVLDGILNDLNNLQ